MARKKIQFLDNQVDTFFACANCNTHLALNNDVVSKSFQGRTGRAFLFNNVFNVELGRQELRTLLTGQHLVADIFCLNCHILIGWKYIRAYDATQRYKEQKYIIEKVFFYKNNNFNNVLSQVN